MDPDLHQRMLDYYNERAPEYEEAYTLGTGTSSIGDPTMFKTEAALLGDVVHRFAHGSLVDQEHIEAWPRKYGVTIRIEHFRRAFYAVSGSFDAVVPAS